MVQGFVERAYDKMHMISKLAHTRNEVIANTGKKE